MPTMGALSRDGQPTFTMRSRGAKKWVSSALNHGQARPRHRADSRRVYGGSVPRDFLASEMQHAGWPDAELRARPEGAIRPWDEACWHFDGAATGRDAHE
ncbi:hypothetical protein CSOJ01_04845 [Colletotrichum sojae]|uniref:Uncharacterized protein n=1 Tax=Colletotrichum sojae TaxID=2175907 RepID=A0A8H6JH54_9PEZI|nr:hypothetical protein CSOJ01_04845 [Colletotrichum sojae]